MQPALADILRHPAVWRATQAAHAAQRGISTGHPALDRALPEAGWPVGALSELLVNGTGTGELSLLMPALRACCSGERSIALIAPPCLPHACAWQTAGVPLDRMLVIDADGIDLLWSAEQALRSGECSAVLLWGQTAGRALDYRALQRLHLAAGTGNAVCIVYRPAGAQAAPSPAPLRLSLIPRADALRVHIIKCRGGLRAHAVTIHPFPAHWQARSVPAASVSRSVGIAAQRFSVPHAV